MSDPAVDASCELCATALNPMAALEVLRLPRVRVVRVLDAVAFPAFYRVIWQAHVAEWTDLDAGDRLGCMEVVTVVEQALRNALNPHKINLASLGNVVPHLHWHVVARFEDDSHFPQPIWGQAQRPVDEVTLQALRLQMPSVDARIVSSLRPG